jgi:hypothetical protein
MNFSEGQVFAPWASFQEFRSPKCLIPLQDRILWHSHQNSSNRREYFSAPERLSPASWCPQLPEISWEWRPRRLPSHTHHARAPRTVYQGSSYTTSLRDHQFSWETLLRVLTTSSTNWRWTHVCWQRQQRFPKNRVYVYISDIYIYIRNELTPLTCAAWDKN